MTWPQLPWLSGHDNTGTTIQMCDRLLQIALGPGTADDFLRAELPDVAADFSAQWAAIIGRTPEWRVRAEYGRHSLDELPYRFFADSLDREAAGIWTSPAGDFSLLAAPLKMGTGQELLVFGGRSVKESEVARALVVARCLGYCLQGSSIYDEATRRIARFRNTLQIASSFAGATETQPLLELIATESTRLINCDRASIFIWDRSNKEVIACPALGVEGGTLRLPDNAGIVGEVIQSGSTIRVDDAYEDDRFNKAVDKKSGYRTRTILCVPMKDAQGQRIGAFQILNKNDGIFSDEDEEVLSQLGIQAAVAMQNTREREELIRSHKQLTEQVTPCVQIIGESAAICALRETVARLADTNLPVLILGESGTGKEVVGQALHYYGPRADKPFVAVNCAALTETLLESELFGHERGAFTDAHDTRQGKFELAEGGTLFLDEIGDMSLGGQAKLLRVLEQKVITRVGGAQTIPINVRVVAATNAKLAEAVRQKKFREDLFYRLSVVTLDLPALRDRPEDIIPLAEHFMERFCIQANRPKLGFAPDAKLRLQAHPWPGNIRELRNLMERVAFLCQGERVESHDLAFILSPERDSAIDMSADVGLTEATRRFQQEFIRRGIKRVKGNMSEAAKLLGLHRSNLYRKMRQLDMNEEADAAEAEE
ncbi:MAG: sigma-54-dependent Fis family transcriptional regulator [Planctomycetaceae bacterium]|nr:sigma-54-dependent Fis family transcriptional regulator [Planctomycetaceae bacterium]